MSTRRLNCARLMMAAMLAGVAGAGAQQKPFTLEQVMSAPFPTGLVAAPAGGKIAWVFDTRGARNVWVAEAPDYQARAVTAYADDNGQDLGELEWTPDAQAIVYTRGGDLENGKEYPNPRSLPQGVEQGVWLIALSGGQPRRLGEGHSPAVSPKGDAVAFVYKEQVWLAQLRPPPSNAADEKATQLIHARGEAESLRWSADGSKLAFVSQRGDHSLIGVYDLAAKTLLYLDPSVDRDRDPVWSPDGRRVAFIRIPASQEAFAFGPRRSAQPWSIRVAEATTGGGREVWRSEAGRGSVFREVQAQNQVLWSAGDRLVFPWERDGWTHLYSVSVQGGPASLLTPGEFEVEDVSLSRDRQEVLFSSNQDDIDRRHIWRVAVEGSRPQRVTQGTGIEWAPVETGDGQSVAMLRSDARRPARPAILARPGEPRDAAPEAIPADFPERELVEPQPVMISASDGLQIHGQLFLPAPGSSGERHPAVIFFHGGSRRQMLLGWHYMRYYSNACALNQYLASRGYIVLSVNYRSGIGYGMEFREALNYGATGASEFNDVLGAGLYLRGRPDVDSRRIGLWGGSYGGYLTALGLARASDLFVAGVDLHGVHDWNLEVRNWVPSYDPEARPEVARLAWESSPLASVKTWRSPVLLIQGDDDRNVPFSEMVRLVEALRKQGVEFQQLVFPDEIHDFLTHRRWLEAYHAAAGFLDGHLRP
jgi:dipeptidyl aminopeptidase/acylaminoacyl peptidase